MNTPKLQAVPSTTDSLDPFRPENLLLAQNFAQTVGVKKLLTLVPIRKPNPQDFVRSHPSPEFRGNFSILELKEEREVYIVTNAMQGELFGEIAYVTLDLAVNMQGVVFLWPSRLPGEDGKDNDWWRTMRDAKEVARTQWVRVKSNMSLGGYEPYPAARDDLPEPVWPKDLSLWDLVKIACKGGKLIDDPAHPAIDRLRCR